MIAPLHARRLRATLGLLLLIAPALLTVSAATDVLSSPPAAAAAAGPSLNQSPYAIDLPTVLRLAGAQNIDVQLARERISEAEAIHAATLWQLLPSVSAGATYRRHDNLIQDVAGNILDVHKQSYTVGPALAAQLDIGEAIFQNLAARQSVKAAEFSRETQRQESIAAALDSYLDLLRAQAAVGVSDLAIAISTNYAAQIRQAAALGLAFKGDSLRVDLQTTRHELSRRQAVERAGATAARLAQSLRLTPSTPLQATDRDLVPIHLDSTNAALDRLIAQALASRPELRERDAGLAVARYADKRVRYGPLAPSLSAMGFLGGLGGDASGAPHRFGESEDFMIGLGWKLGPGGLLDRSRIRGTEAQLRIAALLEEKARDEVIRDVVEAQGRVQSLADQLSTVGRAADTADQVVRLTQQRKEFGVGAVLEDIQAQQELTQARLDLVNIIIDFNKAQFGLQRAIGALGR